MVSTRVTSPSASSEADRHLAPTPTPAAAAAQGVPKTNELASQHAGLYADQRQGIVTMQDPDTGVSVLWLPDDAGQSDNGYFRL